MENNVNKKIILITGATSGIGESIANLLNSKNYQLVITGRNQDKLNELKNNFNNDAHQFYKADLCNNDELNNLITQIKIPLDGVIFSAGVIKPKPIKFITENDIDLVVNTNFLSVVRLTTGLFKQKKINNHSSLIYLSSIASRYPYYGGALYSASKAAIESFSRTVALEYAFKKIRANCISPALVETPILDVSRKINSNESILDHESNYPFGFGKPEDIANMILFLLSDTSKWITGQNYTMDGGFLLNAK